MSLREEKSARKSKPNYITAIISITLVLLNLGILGVALFLTRDLPSSIKENFEFQLELVDNMTSAEIEAYQKKLESQDFTKSIEFVSKEEAYEIMKEELGEYEDLFGYNPLYASLNLKLKSEYLKDEKIKEIEANIMKSGYVKSMNYDNKLIDIINNYSGKIILPLLGFSILLLVIALFLIDSTIRLSMYSKRFLVRSMKLVGATEWFITKPFIKNGIIIGAISGVLASFILITLVILTASFLLNINISLSIINLGSLALFLIVLGVLISLISTKKAVNKYLKLKLDDLY